MRSSRIIVALLAAVLVPVCPVVALDGSDPLSTEDRPNHEESARRHEGDSQPEIESPPLPEGMTLDEVLERSASQPPEGWPDVVADDRPYVFTFIEQLEWRVAGDDADDLLGWDAQGWLGGDLNKFWWKSEGEAGFSGTGHGESETDLLYSRLISPFWYVQAGVQYANEWADGGYEDRFSGVLAVEGLLPYKFEVDSSLYVSEDGDVTLALEAEYDVRITQRLVAQPRLETRIAAQEIPNLGLASGFTDLTLDLRLRYELRRELAPYLGVRYETLLGATENLAETAGEDADHVRFLVGLRFAF